MWRAGLLNVKRKGMTIWYNNSESDFYDKNGMQKKVNALVRLHEALQENSKTASYLESIQIHNLKPDKWSRMYCSEYFNILEYLVWTSHEIKKVGKILAKPAPEIRKSYHHWTTSSSNKMTISLGECFKIKTMLVWIKEYINKNCNLQKSL